MEFVDAHIHLSDEEYADCTEDIVAEAENANVVALVSNATDLRTSIDTLKLTEKYPSTVYAALGIHPWNINSLTEDELQQTLELISGQKNNKAFVAIGEIGLDSKYEKIWDKQLRVLDQMLHLAERLDLPAIIHSRGTTAKIIELLPSYNVKKILLHWFSTPISALAKAVDAGYYITEGPPTVFSNGIREVVRKVPLDNLLTETDGPVNYSRPPFKGKRTTPAFISVVVETIAAIKKTDVADVEQHMLKNFEQFFRVRLN